MIYLNSGGRKYPIQQQRLLNPTEVTHSLLYHIILSYHYMSRWIPSGVFNQAGTIGREGLKEEYQREPSISWPPPDATEDYMKLGHSRYRR